MKLYTIIGAGLFALTHWNLKYRACLLVNPSYSVIIEPHWNLKHLVIAAFCNRLTVIIEPHWNLKEYAVCKSKRP